MEKLSLNYPFCPFLSGSLRPTSDASNEASDQGPHSLLTGISLQNTAKMKIFTRNSSRAA